METPATQKRRQLEEYVHRELSNEPAVRAIVATGSISTGHARPDSDIDAYVFLDPYDWYIVPAESKWSPTDGTYRSIDDPSEGRIQLDFKRQDLAQWSEDSFDWPEEHRAELADGWIAYDRDGRVADLISSRVNYSDEVRQSKVDRSIVMLDQHLSSGRPESAWEDLGAAVAHDRMQAAYDHLVSALFAYNRRWRPWRDREMSYLLSLNWLPEAFADRVVDALNAPSLGHSGYQARVTCLRKLWNELTSHLQADGMYAEDPVGEAFVRGNDEPGRAWNMDLWNERHAMRADARHQVGEKKAGC